MHRLANRPRVDRRRVSSAVWGTARGVPADSRAGMGKGA